MEALTKTMSITISVIALAIIISMAAVASQQVKASVGMVDYFKQKILEMRTQMDLMLYDIRNRSNPDYQQAVTELGGMRTIMEHHPDYQNGGNVWKGAVEKFLEARGD